MSEDLNRPVQTSPPDTDPRPLAAARRVIEAERAERLARCSRRIEAILAEERCRIVVKVVPAGPSLFQGVPAIEAME